MGKGARVRALRKAEPRQKLDKRRLRHAADVTANLYTGEPRGRFKRQADNWQYLVDRGVIRSFNA